MFNWMRNAVEMYYDAKFGTSRNELIMLYLNSMSKKVVKHGKNKRVKK